ncbi:unnamed protein product, partial [Didymodactylos carnosus]
MPYNLYESVCNYKKWQYKLQICIEQHDGIDTEKQQQKTTFEPLINETSVDSTKAEIIASSTKILFLPINQKSGYTASSNVPSSIHLRQLINIRQIKKKEKTKNGFLNSLSEKKRSKRTRPFVEPTTLHTQNANVNKDSTDSLRLSMPIINAEDQEALTSISPILTDKSTELSSESAPSMSHRAFAPIEEDTGIDDQEQKSKTCLLTYTDTKSPFRWILKRLVIELKTNEEADIFCMQLTKCLSMLKERPKHLLAFVNPLCGKGKGRPIYEKKIRTLFDEAQVNVDTIYTERANHARDYIRDETLKKYDGIICVGGDGMFSELCHGLLLKTITESNLDINEPRINLIRPETRIGIIPAGSTDAVVYGTTGMNDPITSALQIITGESLLIDLTTIHSEQGFVRFMATMLAYGFFGDIIHSSESWRCLGPFRYDLAGFKQFLRNKSYDCKLSITLSPADASLHHSSELGASQPLQVTTTKQKLIQHTTRTDDTLKEIVSPRAQFCNRNCDKCSVDDSKTDPEFRLPLQIEKQGRYTTINCLNMPCRCKKSKYGMSPFVHLGDGSFDLILVERSWRLGFLRFLWQVASDSRQID